MDTSYRLSNLWEPAAEAERQETTQDVIRFWIDNHALPQGTNMAERAAQVLLVGRNGLGAIAGVCTVYNAVHPRIEHRMFHFRAFVAPGARHQSLAFSLLLAAQEYLEAHNQRLPADQRALGVLMEVEAAVLQTGPRTGQARWPSSRMSFIGRTPGGAHLRVCYFADAPLKFS